MSCPPQIGVRSQSPSGQKMSTIAIGKDVQQCYEAIVAGAASTSWGVFGYEGQTELKVQAVGADDLSEFPDEFSDGKLQYAFLRILEPNSKLPKFVLIGWCGDGAPRKGVFQQHFSSVASKLTGYHVQITARGEDDVSEQSILKKVEDAAGAKYSMSSPSSVFGPTTSKKPTTNSLVNQLKGQNSPSFNSRKPTLTEPRLPPSASTKPTSSRMPSFAGKKEDDWSAPKTDVHGKIPSANPEPISRTGAVEPVKSSYQPIGRPDINALRAEAQTENPSLSAQGTGTAYKPVEVPKTGSLADRMAAFTGNASKSEDTTTRPRNVSNPLASRYGGAVGGSKPAVPSGGVRESKAIGGLAKNFGSADGKTPAQQWAERKARERGESIPEPVKEAPVKATTYDEREPGESDRDGVSAIRSRFGAVSMDDAPTEAPKPVSVPTPPHMPTRAETPEPVEEHQEENEDEYEQPQVVQARAMPPLPNTGSRPVVSSMPQPPTMPGRINDDEEEEEEQEEQEKETRTPEVHYEPEREPSPDPVPVKNSFKDQLAQTIGGGGAAPMSHAVPASHTKSSKPTAKALYDYEAAEDNELSFEENTLGMSSFLI